MRAIEARPVLEQLGGETTLVSGDLAQLDQVHRLADQIHANGPVDALVHNANTGLGQMRKDDAASARGTEGLAKVQ
jgi:short-subunit dehydrogenase